MRRDVAGNRINRLHLAAKPGCGARIDDGLAGLSESALDRGCIDQRYQRCSQCELRWRAGAWHTSFYCAPRACHACKPPSSTATRA